jgi:tRNA(Ile)-lysidine synthase
VEAWARDARYRALAEMAAAHGVSIVLLGHHQRDQAETFMLQALRGAGIGGLSGMPQSVQRDGVTWKRPWLRKSRDEIDAYVRRHRLRHIDDDSNGDARFARNRLRIEIWPPLVKAFEQADGALAMSAEWAQEASAALEELALIDLRQSTDGEALKVASWLELSLPRRSNALRAWLQQRLGEPAPASLVRRVLDELPKAHAARWPAGAGELRLSRGTLRLEMSAVLARAAEAPEPKLSVRSAGTYPLPGWSGALQVDRVEEGGVPLAWLAHLDLRARVGAEQFQSGIGRPPRSLKKQYQAAGLAMWDRTGPLVFSGGQLVFVPGLGLDARVIGLPNQELVALRWLPAAPWGPAETEAGRR